MFITLLFVPLHLTLANAIGESLLNLPSAARDSPESDRNSYFNDIIWNDEDDGELHQYANATGYLPVENYWPNNGKNIPYAIEGFSPEQKQVIKKALRIIEWRTSLCITFKKRKQEREYIQFYPGRSCKAHIGYVFGHAAKVQLHTDCFSSGIIQHEILHTLGMFHEHNRPDRDQYISLIEHNIRTDLDKRNYEILPRMATYGMPYDVDSIMHYGNGVEISKKGRTAIVAKVPSDNMGQRKGLSVLDVAKLQKAYRCSLDDGAFEGRLLERMLDLNSDLTPGEGTVMLEPFPQFSREPMAREHCALQFTTNCRPSWPSTPSNCTHTQSLDITCNNLARAHELRQMTASMSSFPLKATKIDVYDGGQINVDSFAAIRKQVVVFDLRNCTNETATQKLLTMQFTNLLDFGLINCYNLEIRRLDFSLSNKLKMIAFSNVTIQQLERDTFTDLPALRLLSLEYGLNNMENFNKPLREYLNRLHCSCEFKWYRQWWSSNRQLLRVAAEGEIYRTANSWGNVAISKEMLYLPIDCDAVSFPSGPASINHSQYGFSINAPNYALEGKLSCTSESGESDEPFPDFSTEPLTKEQCDLQFSTHCAPYGGKRFNYCGTSAGMAIVCGRQADAQEIRQITSNMAKFLPRATLLDLYDGSHLSFGTFSPIRRQIVLLGLFQCIAARSTGKLKEMRLMNLLQYGLYNCYNLQILKDDFKYSTKLRVIEMRNSTIRTLESDTFTSLLSLRILALELGLKDATVYNRDIQNYLYRLHCSCEFAPFRHWRKNNSRLLDHAEDKEVYVIPRAVGSLQYSRADMYLPVNCAMNPFPFGVGSINFSQSEFSLHDDNRYC
ncbi:uncharacterized protein LOC129601344 [Paramacrobiotus metropolitanus]|uniref:uncharacterized protein LOC129601344 n=1 Tax=Paramacrobiotus metropolitanus TaxID=2943436 RepID=UPI002445975F|nr:uncharacterized protein LOC129601344 [Paramacrobiotus metropolitanus]